MRLFSTDHKVIGLQYAFTSLLFLLVGFCLILLVRWQLAFPMHPIPLVGGVLTMMRLPFFVWTQLVTSFLLLLAFSQLCGLAHFRMKGRIIVGSDSAFRKFLADEAAAQRNGR